MRRAGARGLAALTVLVAQALAAEEMVTEVIPAGYRSAEELAAILRPLIPPPGSVNGLAGQLVIRTTPANLQELQRVLWTLDRAPANLLVTVKHDLDAEVSRDLAEAELRLRSGNVSAGTAPLRGDGGARAEVRQGSVTGGVRVDRSMHTRRSDDTHSVRVLEGREAWIHSGESVPVPDSHTVITGAGVTVGQGIRYEEFGAGFYVRPRLNGDTVTLDIIPGRRERRGDGSARVQEASTSVSGPLGRWIELGGVGESATTTRHGLTSSRTVTTRRDGRLFVKVERLD